MEIVQATSICTIIMYSIHVQCDENSTSLNFPPLFHEHTAVMPLNMDLSVIPSHDPPATTEPLLSNKPPLPSQGVINRSIVVVQPPASADLSTITEESENYRSSQSSSRFTVSSGSSRYHTILSYLCSALITV